MLLARFLYNFLIRSYLVNKILTRTLQDLVRLTLAKILVRIIKRSFYSYAAFY